MFRKNNDLTACTLNTKTIVILTLPIIVFLGMLPRMVFAEATTTLSETAATTAATSTVIATTSIPLDPHNSADVEARIRSYFADIPIMIAIARCESDFMQYDLTGKVVAGGTKNGMVGVYQINGKIHRKAAKEMGFDIDTLDGNLAYARYLYEQNGTDPWLSSMPCWNDPTVISATTTRAFFTPPALSKNLRLGSKHPEVALLQQYLNRAGFIVASSGPGSPNNETTTFGAMTRDAVRKFQCAQNIVCDGTEASTGYGYVGIRTRTLLLAVAAQTNDALKTAAVNTATETDQEILLRNLTQQIAELQRLAALQKNPSDSAS